MDEPNVQQNNAPAPTPETAPEKTFTQAEVDSIVGQRIAAAKKGMPSKEELAAYRAWKDGQQTEQERWDSLTRDRDESKAALSAAQAELEQYRRERYLLSKGVEADKAEFYAFKIGKMVSDELPFEKAAEKFLADQKPKGPAPQMTVDLTAPLGGGAPPTMSLNDRINQKLRGR